FYVLLPLLPFAAQNGPRALTAVAAWAVLLGLFEFRIFHAPTLDQNVWLLSNVFGRSALFLSGIAAAGIWRFYGVALRARLARIRWLTMGGSEVFLLLVLMTLSFVLQWVAGIGFWAAEIPPNHLWHVAEGMLWASVLLTVLLFPLRSKGLLVNPVTAWVGVISYSLFLVHIPVIAIVLHSLQVAYPDHFTHWNGE